MVDALLLVLADRRDAEFVARCIVGEGPAHHRAASWALLVVAAEIAERLGCKPGPKTQAPDTVSVALRLPPGAARDDDTFPLAMPLAPLRAIVEPSRHVEALADALVDGPAHHALANAALVALFARILEKLDARLPNEAEPP
ncbi:MAG: hypothetical protein HOW73_40640 [Polyangiaceae bacterium]|nr:hypothetical protein [Polyangiaceae bacterium]